MIDFHCHLDLYPNPWQVVEECQIRKVIVLSVTTTPSAWHGTFALGASSPNIYTALGLHPELACQRRFELDLFDQYLPLTPYVGEIGLDGSPELQGSWPMQQDVFRRILASCAVAGGRLLSIHSRRAIIPVLDCLAAQPDAGTAVLHWFSGNNQELTRAIEQRCWFSVGPMMLCSKKGRALVAKMPQDRIITETDGPFTRVDNRPLLPWDADRAVSVLCEIWGLPLVEAREQLLQNVQSLLDRHTKVLGHAT